MVRSWSVVHSWAAPYHAFYSAPPLGWLAAAPSGGWYGGGVRWVELRRERPVRRLPRRPERAVVASADVDLRVSAPSVRAWLDLDLTLATPLHGAERLRMGIRTGALFGNAIIGFAGAAPLRLGAETLPAQAHLQLRSDPSRVLLGSLVLRAAGEGGRPLTLTVPLRLRRVSDP
jgi:hypothetical protein